MEENQPTVNNTLKFIESNLAHVSNPKFEAELILALSLNKDRLDILANPNRLLTPWQIKSVTNLIERRKNGEPFAYLEGQKEFFGRPFIVTSNTLIPRPETEGLINHAKTIVKNIKQPKILDVGTGSGVIAITLALELSDSQITATDISADALIIAKKNASKHDVDNRIKFKEQNLLEGETEKFDLIVANLPYVEREWLTKSDQSVELQQEPSTALLGGEKGTEIIEEFIAQFIHEAPAPKVLLEHGDNQAETLTSLAKKLNPKVHTFSYQDFSGKNRYLLISLEDFLH